MDLVQCEGDGQKEVRALVCHCAIVVSRYVASIYARNSASARHRAGQH